MTEPIERLPLHSLDITEDRLARLREVVPEAFRDGKIDFDVLRRGLGNQVDAGKERFGLQWPGKAACMKVIQEPSVGTLVPVRDQSVDFDTTENLVIEGDNLEVLKLLQKSYYGKVKLIYIDPPYNTGNEFIYPDNFKEGLQDYLKYSGQVDGEGIKLSTNTEADGRYHSKWLSMMYPRLFLARNLLREDGVIAISIDDHEVQHLRTLMDELFGAENHACTFAWQKRDTPANDAKGVSVTHEYVVLYQCSDAFRRNLLPRTEDQLSNYKNPDGDERGPWTRTSLIRKEVRKDRCYPIVNPAGRARTPPPGTSWRVAPEKFRRMQSENRIWWGQEADGDLPFLKRFLTEVKAGVVPVTWWNYEFAGSNRNAKMEIRDLFDGDVPFETPKPVALIRRLLEVGMGTDGTIIDFFAGSGTTGEAVMRLNEEDGGTRRFLLVQLPEPIGHATYPTISAVCRERLRRAGKSVATSPSTVDADTGIENAADLGFRSLKLTTSNFKPWDGELARIDDLANTLEMFDDHLVPGRSAEDILTEILLKAGFPLTAPVETLTLGDKTVYAVAEGALLVCLDRALTLEVIEAMVAREPQQIVCLDAGFRRNDQLKVNAVQAIKARARSEQSTIVLRVV